MENLILEKPEESQILTPSSSGRRSSVSNSPEFEFWMVRNPSFPQPNLLSADELFVNGFLLPLHLLPNSDDPPDPNTHNPNPLPEAEPDSGPEISSAGTGMTASKRWKDIFKKSDRKINEEKEKKKERKIGGGGNGAELNINIWPFSRSRSAGTGGTKPRMVSGSGTTRKVSSAPCSRSNSAGESKSRKWPSSPSRGGVHLGRSSPVWQIRRGGFIGPVVARNEARRSKSTGTGAGAGGGAKARVLNLNVPMCIGYRQNLSCRSENSGGVGVVAAGDCGGEIARGGGGSGESGRGNLFNLRSLFTKKVY